jgi:ribose transport system substrate-binding protein
VVFVDALSRNASGEALRRLLRERVGSTVQAPGFSPFVAGSNALGVFLPANCFADPSRETVLPNRSQQEKRSKMTGSTARRVACLCVAVAVGTGVISGCGDDESTSTSPGAASVASPADEGAVDYVASAKKAIADIRRGTEVAPSPGPGAQPGKDVWFVCFASVVPPCVDATQGVKDASKELGWKVTVVDGKGDPAAWTAGIKRAVAAKADGIYTLSIDCAAAKAGFKAAKDAEIPVVTSTSIDCDGDPQFTSSVAGSKSPTWIDYYKRQGKLRAQYAAAITDGKAKIIQLNLPAVAVTDALDKAFTAEIKKCTTCKVVATKDFAPADLAGTSAAQAVSTLLQQHPEADVLQTDNDSVLQVIAQAIRSANNKDLKVIAGEGYPTTFDLIRDGFVAGAFTLPMNWTGWAAMDNLNRIFAGDDPESFPSAGFDTSLVDKSNLPPKGKAYVPKVDYVTTYKKIWAGDQ